MDEGYEYNHSTFNDLVLSGLVGIQTTGLLKGKLTVNPLVPPTEMPWFTADGVQIGKKIVSVQFDLDGSRYGKGKGLRVLVDGVLKASSPTMAKLSVSL